MATTAKKSALPDSIPVVRLEICKARRGVYCLMLLQFNGGYLLGEGTRVEMRRLRRRVKERLANEWNAINFIWDIAKRVIREGA